MIKWIIKHQQQLANIINGIESKMNFCETRSKRSVEVYKGKNLHPLPPPPTDVTDVTIEMSDRGRHI
jgi:hypothetical protein